MSEITEMDDVTAAIEKLLSREEPQAPVERPTQAAPEPPRPEPVQETPEDVEPQTPAEEPSAEVEGSVREIKASEPDKAVVAESPKAPEAPKTQPSAETTQQDQLLAQLNQLVPQLQAAITGEFRDIKTFEDLQRIASEDPQRYNRYVIHQAQLQHAQAEQQKLQMAAHGRWYQTEQQKLVQALPEIADPVKGVALRNELRAFALKAGYSEQQIAFASSQDVLTLHKAMQFEKWQADQKAQTAKVAAEQAKAREKAANAPPVSRPGVAKDERQTKAQEKFQTFRKSGKTEDLAALLQESGIA